MKPVSRKLAGPLTMLCAAALFILPAAVSALTVEEVVNYDWQYPVMKKRFDRDFAKRYYDLKQKMEIRKAALMREFGCDPSGVCKGAPALAFDACLSECDKKRTACVSTPPPICNTIIDPARKKSLLDRHDQSCRKEQYEYCISYCKWSTLGNEKLRGQAPYWYNQCINCETSHVICKCKSVVDCQHLSNKQKYWECYQKKIGPRDCTADRCRPGELYRNTCIYYVPDRPSYGWGGPR